MQGVTNRPCMRNAHASRVHRALSSESCPGSEDTLRVQAPRSLESKCQTRPRKARPGSTLISDEG